MKSFVPVHVINIISSHGSRDGSARRHGKLLYNQAHNLYYNKDGSIYKIIVHEYGCNTSLSISHAKHSCYYNLERLGAEYNKDDWEEVGNCNTMHTLKCWIPRWNAPDDLIEVCLGIRSIR